MGTLPPSLLAGPLPGACPQLWVLGEGNHMFPVGLFEQSGLGLHGGPVSDEPLSCPLVQHTQRLPGGPQQMFSGRWTQGLDWHLMSSK